MDSIAKLIVSNSTVSLHELANLIGFTEYVLHTAHPDVMIIGETEKNSIGIEEVKKFVNWVSKQPYQQSSKVGIILNAETLTEQAQNSLLKTLEEHPASTQIVLITKRRESLLPTILSRMSHIIKPDKETNSDLYNQAEEFVTSDYWQRKNLIKENLAKFSRPELRSFVQELLRYSQNHRQEMTLEAWNYNINLVDTALLSIDNSVSINIILDNFLYYL